MRAINSVCCTSRNRLDTDPDLDHASSWRPHPGLADIVASTAAKVFGPAGVSGVSSPDDGDQFSFAERSGVLATPGHTLTAELSHRIRKAGFHGDTLFAMGCGRLFEGNADMMWPASAN